MGWSLRLTLGFISNPGNIEGGKSSDFDNTIYPDKTTASRVWQPTFPTIADNTAEHDPSSVDFRHLYDNAYVATLFIGTPPQPVSLVLDVSSSDVLVLNHPIEGHAYYDHTTSTTYGANGTRVAVDEGTPYEVDGFVSRDHVSLMNAGVVVRNQLLVELTGPDKLLGGVPFDGVIGLGPGRAATTGAPSFVRAMIDQQLLDRPEVGLGFDNAAAHVLFGGIDASYARDAFHYFQQQHTSGWTVPLRGIQAGDTAVVSDGGLAAIEMVELIYGPRDQVDALADRVGAQNYALECDSAAPNMTILLGDGLSITLTKHEYTIPVGQGQCLFAIVPVATQQWTLGLMFLRKVYTVLDYGAAEREERIGFAPLKDAADVSGYLSTNDVAVQVLKLE